MKTAKRLKNINTIAINVRIPHECDQWLRSKADAEGISLGQALTRVLRVAQADEARDLALGANFIAQMPDVGPSPGRASDGSAFGAVDLGPEDEWIDRLISVLRRDPQRARELAAALKRQGR